MPAAAKRSRRQHHELEPPSPHNWLTTDQDEIIRRRWRARNETFTITNRDARHPIFSNFRVKSGSGLTYVVEVHDLEPLQLTCQCVDFHINGLGTCKHGEAVVAYLQARFKRQFKAAAEAGSPRVDVRLDRAADTLLVQNGQGPLPRPLRSWFGVDRWLRKDSAEEAVSALRELAATTLPNLRLSQEIEPWLEARRRVVERKDLRREYELNVQRGAWPVHETKVPLFPYQRDGMLHLAFTERALLADEMGLGKTIQAIAACALLQRLGKARRVLVVTPASLKTEWEEQIQRFTELPYQLVYGARHERLLAYERAALARQDGAPEPAAGPFFTIVNYEQMLADALEVNQRLQPDIVVLDEAQRIKNWSTKTTQAIKRLRSRYAFVLTGTPIENRIDELYSLMDYLDPTLLGPLFRFNREYYALNDRGRPEGYNNLDKLQQRIRPYLLRRRKSDVETELPARSDRHHFVSLSPEQKGEYDGFEMIVARLADTARRRPLTQPEQERMLLNLAKMRMTCDTNYILQAKDRSSSKLPELEKILEECRDNPGVKVIVFSEWQRMLELVREVCQDLDLGFAWHTGSVPQRRRRAEINLFKSDPQCRVFLSTDSGSTGLNLQNASVVINCDLPWNPAKLEQRIARAWRKHQTQPVTVINLVARNTIEERMIQTIAHKQALSDGVLDSRGDLAAIKIRTGRQAFFEKLEQLGIKSAASRPGVELGPPPLPADRSLGFAKAVEARLRAALVRCEERYSATGPQSVLYVVVNSDAELRRADLASLHEEYFRDTDPLAPVRLEVVDRATDVALQRLVDAGLLARTVRATRPLFPLEAPEDVRAALTPAEREQVARHRALAGRKLKLVRVLADTGFTDEAHPALVEAGHALARALAIEQRLPGPPAFADTLQPPFAHVWGDGLETLRAWVTKPGAACQPAMSVLQKHLA